MSRRVSLALGCLSLILILTLVQACGPKISYPDTLAAIEKTENELKDAERNMGAVPLGSLASRLDSLYSIFVNSWPDSVLAPQFLFNKANLKAEYEGNFDECIRLLDSLRSVWPQSMYAERAQFLIGYTYANQLQDTSNARKAYEGFLQAYPESDLAPSVRFEIGMLGKSLDMLDSLLNNIPRD